jgi:hypothetical protein
MRLFKQLPKKGHSPKRQLLYFVSLVFTDIKNLTRLLDALGARLFVLNHFHRPW